MRFPRAALSASVLTFAAHAVADEQAEAGDAGAEGEGESEEPKVKPSPVSEAEEPVHSIVYFNAPEPTLDLPVSPEFLVPVSRSRRDLVLPPLAVSVQAAFLYDRPSDWTIQVPNFGVGLAVGVGRHVEVDLAWIAPIEGAMQLDAGFLWQPISTPSFLLGIGGHVGFLSIHEEPTEFSLRPAIEVPIALRPHNMFRVETGLTLEAFAPTDGTSPGYVGFVSRTFSPTIAGPGIPLRGFLNVADELFFSLETGFGVLELRPDMPYEISDGVFMPLGWSVGGTIPLEGRPLLDVEALVSFPYLLIGAEDPATTEVWQMGLTVKLFAGL